MCLILFALNSHEKYKLILAANRDEFFDRPAVVVDFWPENKNVMGGKDQVSGGTWLGLRNDGRFIAVTNFRDSDYKKTFERSRGELSGSYLLGSDTATEFLVRTSGNRKQYSGFNLLVSDNCFESMIYYSSITDKTMVTNEGIHGLSNAYLDTPWPKVTTGIKNLQNLMASGSFETSDLIALLKDNTPAPDDQLPDTGIPFDLEKKLSPVFISMKGYGTRCSTALLVDHENRAILHEVTYNEKGDKISEKTLAMQLKC